MKRRMIFGFIAFACIVWIAAPALAGPGYSHGNRACHYRPPSFGGGYHSGVHHRHWKHHHKHWVDGRGWGPCDRCRGPHHPYPEGRYHRSGYDLSAHIYESGWGFAISTWGRR